MQKHIYIGSVYIYKIANYKYMQSMNSILYNGWERVWTFKFGLHFAISIDFKIVSEDASLAKPTILKLRQYISLPSYGLSSYKVKSEIQTVLKGGIPHVDFRVILKN